MTPIPLDVEKVYPEIFSGVEAYLEDMPVPQSRWEITTNYIDTLLDGEYAEAARRGLGMLASGPLHASTVIIPVAAHEESFGTVAHTLDQYKRQETPYPF